MLTYPCYVDPLTNQFYIQGVPEKNATQIQFHITLIQFSRNKSFVYQFLGKAAVHICVKLQLKCLNKF